MRAYFTVRAKRPAGSHNGNRRGRNSRVKRDRPPVPRITCDWGRGALPANMRALHDMTQAAGGLRRREPERRELESVAAHRGGACCAAGVAEPGAASPMAVIARKPRWDLHHLPIGIRLNKQPNCGIPRNVRVARNYRPMLIVMCPSAAT